MRLFASVACSGLLFVASAAQAQSNEKPRRFHLGFGADAMDHLGDECIQSDASVGCSKGTLLFPFTFSASFRALPWFSIGARFAAASKNTDAGGIHSPRHISIWQLSLEPRAYPLGHALVAPFVGLALGYGSIRQTSAEVPERGTHDSLLVGGVAGADFTITDWLAITPQIRVVRMDLTASQPEQVDGHSTYYTGKVWLSFGVQLVALLPV